ncbi:hypothetical protein TVAG_003160 [Trichomonas vaginalis G3]|uniref:Uncharacterized protein n=1 Tax=Trichomonas vaginalis (strain ATCC PRA-98 / G3) TaxID=412133 RepID=A2EZT9_TRIV3|nr:serine/threonine-protein phosphatase 6 regulatory subunit family [Trichomonas vaginalis G3]EAY01861.1 hypothetical protein TVAG_003160 [Trichomonas vaginalis G3]KAI5497593.1 serine/threonine-protein phosphatase 6 regulatory subunit family [Trichomonas vaginalis G3]|eukprot:XP_001330431.1 hypothetical protein [Trichomonas vaginalis G3]
MKVWHFGGPNLASITALVSKPETSVEAVLDDQALNAALRNNLQSLISFLIDNEEKFNHLLDMVLTDFVPQTDLPAKTTRCALTVLSSSTCTTIMQKLRGNPIFIDRMNSFPQSDYASHPRACGHFGRIVEAFAHYSSGDFLDSLPSLKSFFIHNMGNLGLRELFTNLATEYPTYFPFDQQYLNELTLAANSDNGFYILTALDTVTRNKKQIFDQICKVEIEQNLFAITKNAQIRPLIASAAFKLIDRIAEAVPQSSPVLELVNKESETYSFDSIENDSVLASALLVLHTKSDKVLLRILSDGQPTFVCDGIFRSIRNMTDSELNDFLTRTDFINRMIEQFPKTKTNVHLSLLAEYLKDKIKDNEAFRNFIDTQYAPREQNRQMEYGGSRPHGGSDSAAESSTQSSSDNDDSSDSDDSPNDLRFVSDSSDDDSDEEDSLSDDYDSSSDDDDEDEKEKESVNMNNCAKLHKFLSRTEAPAPPESSSSSDEEDGAPVQMAAAPALNLQIADLRTSDDILIPEPLHSDDDNQYEEGGLSSDSNDADPADIINDITKPLKGSDGPSESDSEEEEEKKVPQKEEVPLSSEKAPETAEETKPAEEATAGEQEKPAAAEEEQKPADALAQEEKQEEPKIEKSESQTEEKKEEAGEQNPAEQIVDNADNNSVEQKAE